MPQRRPTKDDLNLINQYQPRDAEPLTEDELLCFEFIGADNLLNRSGSKWHYTAIQQLADRMAGLKLLLDHDWDEVDKSQALIFRAWVETEPTAPIAVMEAAGNGTYNRSIVADEGYISLHFDCAIRASSPLVDALRFAEVGNISLGGFQYKDIWCPICDCSFYSDDCPHYIGYHWDDEKSNLVMPYYERKDVFDLGEASIVTIPNLPGAKVV